MFIRIFKIVTMRILVLIAIVIFSVNCVFAQSKKKISKKRFKAELKAGQIKNIRAIMDSRNFIFKAESVKPLNMKTLTFTDDFGVEVRNDSIFSYLPFYGNTYVRDFSSHKNSPLGFIQPVNSYSKRNTKTGYILKINVKHEHEFINLKFYISKTGYTSLSASFLNRQSISFEGEILVPQPIE